MAAVTRNDKDTTLELDYHDDTYVLGNGAILVAGFNEPVHVQGYDPALGTKTYRTITGAVGYYNSLTENSFHLLIHRAIYIPTLDNHLLCPMQCRVAGVDINDCPNVLTTLPQENSRCMIAKDEYSTRTVLPLAL